MDKKIIYEYDRRNRELFTQQIEENSGCIVNWAFFSKNDSKFQFPQGTNSLYIDISSLFHSEDRADMIIPLLETLFNATSDGAEIHYIVESQYAKTLSDYLYYRVEGIQSLEEKIGIELDEINNIVDITNFVMLETGQPMHAFNYNDIGGHKIIVRNAEEGETITTLDGTDHNLTPDMLVIADGEKPSCLAGIMGGKESEIESDTTDLFLESAKFRRDNIRHTGRALGIRTEASGRYERGVDIMNVSYAMERALQLISELDAGDIIDGEIDLNNGLPEERIINVTTDKIMELIGVDVPDEKIVWDFLTANRIHDILQI